jgi:hypothetical protein
MPNLSNSRSVLAATVLSVALFGAIIVAPSFTRAGEGEYSESERSLWSLRPVVRPAMPEFESEQDRDWIRTPVDGFILRRLKQKELSPAQAADRATLIRRVTFDLTGLPPTPQEVAAFLADDAPDAYERLVDRLLASPQYGEHWGQHWLDVVRFAESEGFEYDRHRPGAWRYRDYVIASLNGDKPYDRFVREQLAGDELDEPGSERLVAAGFHRLGAVRRNAGNAEVAFSRNEVLTERTNIVGAALLGLTIGCARCHDHMFDPIRQRDYYQMQAFLASTYEHDVQIASPAQQQEWQQQTDAVKAELARLKEKLDAAPLEQQDAIRAEMARVEETLPEPLPTISTVKNDPEQLTPIYLLDRGDPDTRQGERLSMRELGVLLPAGRGAYSPEFDEPKSALARWITSGDNPLTARVMANRVWQWHFGRGIVGTPNDFGNNGETPSHPELLDYLASELVRGGWRLKPLHRLIVLSSTYRQASHRQAAHRSNLPRAAEIDPSNRLLWRQNRRRLEAGELRDAMLAASRRINLAAGGESVIVPVEQEMVDLLYKPSQWKVTADVRQHDRRSVYLVAKRNLRLPFMEVFDQPDLQTSCSRREASTHAPQALELLNGRFSNDAAASLAERLRREAGSDIERQIELAFQRVAGRDPTAQEREFSREFLEHGSLEEFALAMLNLNAFLYVE